MALRPERGEGHPKSSPQALLPLADGAKSLTCGIAAVTCNSPQPLPPGSWKRPPLLPSPALGQPQSCSLAGARRGRPFRAQSRRFSSKGRLACFSCVYREPVQVFPGNNDNPEGTQPLQKQALQTQEFESSIIKGMWVCKTHCDSESENGTLFGNRVFADVMK